MLAREQGWYEADDRIDAALPFLNRDLGWDDRAWGATEHGFQLLLDRYVRPGDRVLEIGAAKSWASQHLVPLGCEYVACDLVVDPLIGLGRGAFFEQRVGPYLRVQADGERLPFADGELRPRVLRRDAPPRARPAARWSASSRASRAAAASSPALNEGTRAPVPERREPGAGAREGARHQRARAHDVGVRVGVRALRPAAAAARVRGGPGRARAAARSPASSCALGELPATLWALNAYPYAGLSLFARRR